MKVFIKTDKSLPGFAYWGDFGEIDTGWSSGEIVDNNKYPGEKLHYHKTGTTYFLSLSGVGLVQVDGKEIELPKETLLQINPGEKYKVLGAKETPFKYIVVCTSKERSEKVEVE